MNDILEKYSAKELLEWLRKQDANIFLDEKIEEDENRETFVKEVINVDRIEEKYLKSVLKYTIIKRGTSLYIFNNDSCMEILRFRFTPENYEHVQSVAESLTKALNENTISFVPKYSCK